MEPSTAARRRGLTLFYLSVERELCLPVWFRLERPQNEHLPTRTGHSIFA